MKLHFIAFITTALILSSCGITKTTESMKSNQTGITKIPTETFWKLQTLEGKDFSDFKKNGNEIGFTLFADNNRVSGYAGCNNFFGTYKIEPDNQIRFSSLGATKMMCPDGEFNENEFLNVFANADTFKITGTKLEFYNGEGTSLAVFTKNGETANVITEKYWKLKTLDGQPVKMKKNQEREIYFMLKTNDNRVTGFAGCNGLMGTYTLKEGNRIHFSQMATTLMACPDLNIDESEFLKVFELADNYTIKNNELSLNVGRRAPLAVFKAVYFD